MFHKVCFSSSYQKVSFAQWKATLLILRDCAFTFFCVTLLQVGELRSVIVTKQNSGLCPAIMLHLKHVPSPRSSFGNVRVGQDRIEKATRFSYHVDLYLSPGYTTYYWVLNTLVISINVWSRQIVFKLQHESEWTRRQGFKAQIMDTILEFLVQFICGSVLEFEL